MQEKNDCDEAEKSDDSSSPKVPTRYVMGRQRDLVFVDPPFYMKPIDKDRGRLSDAEKKRLQDQGVLTCMFLDVDAFTSVKIVRILKYLHYNFHEKSLHCFSKNDTFR